MKSFLDRFRRKGQEAPATDVAPHASKTVAPEPAKNTAAASSAPAAKPAAPESNLEAKVPPLPSPPAAGSPEDNEVNLELGDFLHRIPPNLLRPGPHDVTTKLRFDIGEVSALIANGKTTINLIEIYRRASHIFRTEVYLADHIEIRFPWQKLLNQVQMADPSVSAKGELSRAAAESLGQKLRSRRPARNIIPGAPPLGTGEPAPLAPAAPAPSGVPISAPDVRASGRARQPNWFSKPITESNRFGTPAEAGPPKNPVNLELFEEPAITTAEAASRSEQKPPRTALSEESPSQLNREDLIRARDDAFLKLAEVKADYERQISGIAQEREAIASQRDKALAELEHTQRELEETIEALTEEIGALKENLDGLAAVAREREAIAKERDMVVAELERARKELAGKVSVSPEQTSKETAERETLQNEVEAKRRELDALRTDFENARKSSEERFAALVREREVVTQERDKVLLELEHTRGEVADKIEQIELQQSLSNQSREDAAQLLANRDALQKELAEKSAELNRLHAEVNSLQKGNEEKLVTIAAARDASTQERDKVLADLERTRKELAARIQQEGHPRTLEDADDATAEREVLRQELVQKAAKLESLTAEVAALKRSSEEKLTAVTQERDKLIADLERARKEAADKLAETELQQCVSARSVEDAAKLLADREALREELATKTGELDKLRADITTQKKGGDKKYSATIQEREKFAADLEHARKELAGKTEQLALQQSLGSKSAEDAAKANAERAALEKELAAKTGELNKLAADLAALKKSSEDKLVAVGQEHEVSLAQKAERSKKEYQRQIEELQRRIAAFESGQRETAQELSRERETRIKAERSLSSAERARQEATAMVESLRVETRRDAEAAARKRESEFARAQYELQEKLDALAEAHRKTSAERDDLTLQIEKLRAGVAEAEAAAKDSFWESRAITTLEEDISNYRTRIKTILAERDDAAREIERVQAAQAAANSDQKRINDELQASRARLEREKSETIRQLEDTRRLHAQEAQQVAAARAAAQVTDAIVAELRQQIDKLGRERDKVQADYEKLFTELEALKTRVQQEREQFASERAALETGGNAAVTALRAQVAELQSSLATQIKEREDLHRQLAAAALELNRVQAESSEEFAALSTEHASLLATHRAAAADFTQTRNDHETALSALRNELAAAKAAVGADLAVAQSNYESARAKLEEEKAAFSREKEELEQKLSDTQRAADEIAVRAQMLDTTVRNRESALREKEAEIALLKASSENALATLSHEREQDLATLTAEKDRQLAALTVDKAKAVAALVRERDDLSTKLAETEKTLDAKVAALTAERDEAQRESSAIAQRLAAFAVESDRKVEDLARTHEILASDKSSLAAELEGEREAHKAQSAVFAREFKTVVKQRDDALAEADGVRAQFQQRAAALARDKIEMERAESEMAARFEREVGRLRKDRDLLLRQRDELHDRMSRMIEEQRQMLTEITAQSARPSPLSNDVIQTPREPKDTNVIEITAATISAPLESDRGINLPRIRPVPIRPPNVRVL